jgi:carbon monoxide dehydrogenase subunit G
MNVEYSGTIPVRVEDAWAVLSDLERVAGCLPGVRLDQVNGDEVAGTVTVPLGPLRLTYRGEAAFVERDEAARRVVIDAGGRDSHGEQAASARVTVQLRDSGKETHVTAVANVHVRGMSAPVGFAVREFGGGILREFVHRLGQRTRPAPAEPKPAGPAPAPAEAGPATAQPAAPGRAPSAQAGPAPTTTAAKHRVPEPRPRPAPRLRIAHGPGEAVYPVRPPSEGPPAGAQYVPYAGAVAVGVLIGWLMGRRRRR